MKHLKQGEFELYITTEPSANTFLSQAERNDYRPIRFIRDAHVCAYVLNKNLKFRVVSCFDYFLHIHLIDFDFDVFAFYIPPSEESKRWSLIEMYQHLTALIDRRSIIVGDINCHLEQFGDRRTDKGGRSIYQTISSVGGCKLINRVNDPTFFSHFPDANGQPIKTTIDWIVVSNDLSTHTQYVNQAGYIDSDHVLQKITISLSPQSFPSNQMMTSTFVHATTFVKLFNNNLNVINPEDFAQYVFLYGQEASRKTPPRSYSFLRSGFAKKKALMHPTIKTYSRTCKAKVTKKKRFKKRKASLATSIERANMVLGPKATKSRVKITTIDVEGASVSDSKEIFSLILDKFFPSVCSQLEPTASPPPLEDKLPLTYSEIEHAIKSVKITSPGPDGVNIVPLKKLFCSKPLLVASVIRSWFMTCRIPLELKKVNMIMIPKDPQAAVSLNNLRPIFLFNSCTKILGKILLHKLKYDLTTRAAMIASRWEKSADLVYELNKSYQKVIQDGKRWAILKFDCQSAYSNVYAPAILHAMVEKGCHPHLINCIANLLDETEVSLTVKGDENCRKVGMRLLPGGNLSSLLFRILLDHTLSKVQVECAGRSYKYQFFLFVDDLIVLIDRIKTKKATMLDLSLEIEWFSAKLTASLQEINLSFSPTKFKIMASGNKTVTCNGVESERTIEILGITFASNGSFIHHVKKLIRKSLEWKDEKNAYLGTLNRSTRGRIMTVYLSSSYFYAVDTWFNVTNRYHHLVYLEAMKIDRLFFAMNIRIRSDISLACVWLMTDDLPFHLKLELQCKKLEWLREDRVHGSLESILNGWSVDLPPHLRSGYDVTITPEGQQPNISFFDLTLAVDASKKGDHVGIGFALTDRHGFALDMWVNSLPGYLNSYQGELLAVYFAVNYFCQSAHANSKVNVVSDNKTVVENLNNIHTECPVTRAIRQMIIHTWRERATKISITWCAKVASFKPSVAAHHLSNCARIRGENMIFVPRLAKSATQLYRDKLVEIWKFEYQNHPSGSIIKKYFPNFEDRKKKGVTFNYFTAALYSGYTDTADIRANRYKLPSIRCPCGKSEKTYEHILFSCEILAPYISEEARVLDVPLDPEAFFRHERVHFLIRKIAPTVIAFSTHGQLPGGETVAEEGNLQDIRSDNSSLADG